ncbi:uncharacterized protein LOC120332710 isoform X1 [Styela clava]
MIDLAKFIRINSEMASMFETPQSVRYIPSARNEKSSKARKSNVATLMTSTPKDLKSARLVPSPRGQKATKVRRSSIASLLTSPPKDEWGDTLMTSSSDEPWNKIGVTNMGFKPDENDCISPDISRDSGFGDVITPMTSPMTEEAPGVYHYALSRRKSLADSFDTNNRNLSTTTPSNERLPLVRNNHFETPKVNYGSANERFPDSVFDSSPCCVPSPAYDIIGDRSPKKERSTSLIETQPYRPFNSKPRSSSQPTLRPLSSRLYSTLDSVSEEDFVIDSRGISRPMKRSSPEDAIVPNSSGFTSKTPLIGATANGLTIYPGYQSQSGISLNDWQVKLGEKEPEQCRCDKTPAPPPKKETPPPKSDSSSSIEYVTGRQVSIGDSEERPLTDDEGSQEIEGIVKKFGGSSKMSEIMEAPLGPSPLKPAASSSTNGSGSYSGTALLSVDMPPPSAGRRRKSLKTIFRLGFLTTKSKQRTKSKSDDGMPSPDTGPAQPPGRRVVQRRMSRLEMNEPIEDIFSEVKFETIQKRPSTSNSAGNDVSEDDDDIIEDPEVIMRSIMSKKIVANEDDDIFFEGVVKPGIDVNGDVTNPELLEKDLLLPESERNRPPLAPVSEEISIKISDEDSR